MPFFLVIVIVIVNYPTLVTTANWSYKYCKAPVKSSSPINQHPTFLQRSDVLPVTQPTVAQHWRERTEEQW